MSLDFRSISEKFILKHLDEPSLPLLLYHSGSNGLANTIIKNLFFSDFKESYALAIQMQKVKPCIKKFNQMNTKQEFDEVISFINSIAIDINLNANEKQFFKLYTNYLVKKVSKVFNVALQNKPKTLTAIEELNIIEVDDGYRFFFENLSDDIFLSLFYKNKEEQTRNSLSWNNFIESLRAYKHIDSFWRQSFEYLLYISTCGLLGKKHAGSTVPSRALECFLTSSAMHQIFDYKDFLPKVKEALILAVALSKIANLKDENNKDEKQLIINHLKEEASNSEAAQFLLDLNLTTSFENLTDQEIIDIEEAFISILKKTKIDQFISIEDVKAIFSKKTTKEQALDILKKVSLFALIPLAWIISFVFSIGFILLVICVHTMKKVSYKFEKYFIPKLSNEPFSIESQL